MGLRMKLVWRKILYDGMITDFCDIFCIDNCGCLYKVEVGYVIDETNYGFVEVVIYEEDHYGGFQSIVCTTFSPSQFANIDEKAFLEESKLEPNHVAVQCFGYVCSLFWPFEYMSVLFGGI